MIRETNNSHGRVAVQLREELGKVGRQLEDVGLEFDGGGGGAGLRVHDAEEEGEMESGLSCLEGELDRIVRLRRRGEVGDDDAVGVDGGGNGGLGVEEQIELVVGRIVATPRDGTSATGTAGSEKTETTQHVDAFDRLRLHFLENEAEIQMDVLLHA